MLFFNSNWNYKNCIIIINIATVIPEITTVIMSVIQRTQFILKITGNMYCNESFTHVVHRNKLDICKFLHTIYKARNLNKNCKYLDDIDFAPLLCITLLVLTLSYLFLFEGQKVSAYRDRCKWIMSCSKYKFWELIKWSCQQQLSAVSNSCLRQN